MFHFLQSNGVVVVWSQLIHSGWNGAQGREFRNKRKLGLPLITLRSPQDNTVSYPQGFPWSDCPAAAPVTSPSHTPSASAVWVRSLLTCIVCQLAPSSLLGAGSDNQWAQCLYHSLCSPLQYLGVHCRHRKDLLLNISCYWWEKCSPERAGSTIKRAQQVHVRDWTGIKISCLLASYSCHHTSCIDKIFKFSPKRGVCYLCVCVQCLGMPSYLNHIAWKLGLFKRILGLGLHHL